MRKLYLLFMPAMLLGCGHNSVAYYMPGNRDETLINKQGLTLEARFKLPAGYNRTAVNDFGTYLRTLDLKPHGADVHYYNGGIKPKNVHAAVLDVSVGDKNLQQCADAVMRLRAEYLFAKGRYDDIHFHFTNGFDAQYSKWRQGYRISVKSSDVAWVKTAVPATSHESFIQYMQVVFSYAGTMSLSKELKPVALNDILPGDVFIHGGSPGHAVIVLDVASNKQGDKIFMIAQSYMPAQEIEVLINSTDEALSPWYKVDANKEEILTPEWDFTIHDLKRFQ